MLFICIHLFLHTFVQPICYGINKYSHDNSKIYQRINVLQTYFQLICTLYITQKLLRS